MNKGHLISIEGFFGDRPTLPNRIAKGISNNLGLNAAIQTSLNSSDIALQIARVGQGNVCSRTNILLDLARRAQHLNEIVEPTLNEGKTVVVSDYYGYLDNDIEAEPEYAREVEGIFTGLVDLKPDLSIFINRAEFDFKKIQKETYLHPSTVQEIYGRLIERKNSRLRELSLEQEIFEIPMEGKISRAITHASEIVEPWIMSRVIAEGGYNPTRRV